MNTKPLSPDEILKSKEEVIPEFVIVAVNNLLKKHYNGNRVIIKQDDIINEIIRINPTVARQTIFDENYLDFEHVFSAAGWNVSYDKPGLHETYSATFAFDAKF